LWAWSVGRRGNRSGQSCFGWGGQKGESWMRRKKWILIKITVSNSCHREKGKYISIAEECCWCCTVWEHIAI
jgi:hypothetical protein